MGMADKHSQRSPNNMQMQGELSSCVPQCQDTYYYFSVVVSNAVIATAGLDTICFTNSLGPTRPSVFT